MRKVVFGINISIDGYCGHESAIAADDELHQYFTNLLHDSGVHIIGRNTYPKIVFSTTMKSVEWNNTTLLHSNLREEIIKLKEQSGKDIAIGSLNIASQLAGWDLIDEYHLVVHPVIAGKGPRLFDSVENLTLKLIGTKIFQSGAIALHYKK